VVRSLASFLEALLLYLDENLEYFDRRVFVDKFAKHVGGILNSQHHRL
jgi:hypothetical protein